MASDLLSVGTQSVLTSQRQLNTTGHNISNVNTEGYSRQSVIQGTNDPRQFGGSTYGMGVHVENVRRSWDQFAVNELNLSTTNFSNKLDGEANLDMLSNLLSSMSSKKIPETLNEWFDSLKTLADSPNDMGARKVVLEKARLSSETLNSFQDTIRQQFDVTNKKLDMGIDRINQLAIEIRDLHRLMMRTPGEHNDLRDQHETLIKELSEYTKVTVTPRNNAEGFNVHIGNGHTLVSGTEASQLKMIEGYPDVHQRRLAIYEGQSLKPIKSIDMDGKLGAMLDMRDTYIPGVLDELGRLAASFSHGVNLIQDQGLDLYGEKGGPIFTPVNSPELVRSRVVTATGSDAQVSVYLDDLPALKGGEYALRYDGDRYQVTLPNGQVVQPKMLEKGEGFLLDGMRVEINQRPEVGEKILLRPTRQSAAQMQMVTDDPKALTAQSYEASTTFAKGTAEFKIESIGDIREFELVISPDGTQFAVVDKHGKLLCTPTDYPPKGTIEIDVPRSHPDYHDGEPTIVTLTEGALPQDRFTANLVPSEGDNGNLRKLQKMQTAKFLDGGESTMIDVYHNLNTDVGLKTATARRLSDIARLENETAQERVASISGVNMDEEASNLMRFQQAYMASSKIMQAANDTFNTILQLR
ncbi:flagellar hook-associated protein FlgK [Vibrio sp. SM6]|uniref:Flagellar hook-associated protein 1 n=1 Tax=Vibrio agarilyticus TaxID=2726741 RepID=A0A7X8YFK9_9VIBR|nr:flagellar hook-associated protein FlgK [Vibrio agarilyticus]NLS11620.1 flagellar hook-associated protein FlgK [Vibrio agarilyticus]